MKITETLKKTVENARARNVIIAVGFIGIAVILISNLLDAGVGKKTGEGDEFSVKSYSERIESNLEEVISKINGAGKTKTLLTMDESVEYVYLKDSATKTKEIQPHIRGVLVVCEGGDDPVVVERVTNAVTGALGVSTAKVCVTKLSE